MSHTHRTGHHAPAVWIGVSKSNQCPICKKPDWCSLSDKEWILCMRVQSTRPSKGKAGGWLHKLGNDIPRIFHAIKKEPEVVIDAKAIWKSYLPHTTGERVKRLASKLKVEALALMFLGFVWSPENNAWIIPMRNEHAEIVGLRVRNEEGDKWAVKGSKVGMFYTTKLPVQNRIYIMEGPTDTAAAITLEMTALGRPSCMGLEDMICSYIKKHKFREVVIVSDNDTPGMNGAVKLQEKLKVPSVVFLPPCKDLREFVAEGGDRETIEAMLRDYVWTIPDAS